ncbi:hypothetical protein AX768_24615 [Burkholderia sp. PAMC 28687]|nr:hypothetical protein AX768_24615 [Burkholderia sp. PAMC 28687]
MGFLLKAFGYETVRAQRKDRHRFSMRPTDISWLEEVAPSPDRQASRARRNLQIASLRTLMISPLDTNISATAASGIFRG